MARTEDRAAVLIAFASEAEYLWMRWPFRIVAAVASMNTNLVHAGIISMSSDAVHNNESWNAEFRLHGNEPATQMRPPSVIEDQIVGLYIIIHHRSPESLMRIVIWVDSLRSTY